MRNPKLVGTLLLVVPPVMFVFTIVLMGVTAVMRPQLQDAGVFEEIKIIESVLGTVSFCGILIGIPLGGMLLSRSKGSARWVLITVAVVFLLVVIVGSTAVGLTGGV